MDVLGAEVVQRGQSPIACDLEDRSIIVCPATPGCPVQVPVEALNERSVRAITIGFVED